MRLRIVTTQISDPGSGGVTYIERNVYLERELVVLIQTQLEKKEAIQARDALLKMNEYLKIELEKKREVIRTWTNSGRKTQDILSSGNWKEGLGYGDEKKGTKEVKPTVKTKVNPVKFVPVKSDTAKSEDNPNSTSDKPKQDKPTEINIGLMTKKQLKHKLKEVKNVNKEKPTRKNRNGKEGVNKSNNYKPIPNAPRKLCYNYGKADHLASFCRKNKGINVLPPKSGVKNKSVRFKPQNPCFHCGSVWHSIYTCKEYHSLYYDYYEIKPSLKKVNVVPTSVKSDIKSEIKSDISTDKNVSLNSDIKSAAKANKLKKAIGSKKVWVLKTNQ